jgi:UPF0755 protein
MPDTYKFSRGMTRLEMVERMQAEQKKFLANLWETRASDLPLKSIEEAIILASIVEKEARRADERARVAGVFINRLRKGMRLQSDPTIPTTLTRRCSIRSCRNPDAAPMIVCAVATARS